MKWKVLDPKPTAAEVEDGKVRMLASYSQTELEEMLTSTKSRGKWQRIKKILGIHESGDEDAEGEAKAPERKRDIKALIKKVEEQKKGGNKSQ